MILNWAKHIELCSKPKFHEISERRAAKFHDASGATRCADDANDVQDHVLREVDRGDGWGWGKPIGKP